MTILKYDNSDVEAGGGGEEPQPGLYPGSIVTVTHRDKKANGDPTNDLEVVIDIGSEYVRKWMYIQLDNPATKWKYREFTDALGLPPKGSLDTTKIAGKKINVKIKAGVQQDGKTYRGEIKSIYKPGSEDGDEPSEEAEDYAAWSVEELEAEIESRELEMPSGRKTAAKLASVLEESDAAGESDGETPADEAPTDEYDSWDDNDLKAEIEERGIAGNISGRKTTAKMIEALRAYDAGPNAGQAEDKEAPEDDYDTWEQSELEAEVKERISQGAEINISGRKTKEKLIEALRGDDASQPF